MDLTYAGHETRISRLYLERVLRVVVDPVWIIGGWGVWFSVNDTFRQATGRDYAFSRDIDLGFHVDPDWTKEDLADSSLARTTRELTNLGFQNQGFRLYREFHTETGNPLEPGDAEQTPRHFVFPLAVDLLVDHQHPHVRDVLGFEPVDEPRLANVANTGGTPLPDVSPHLSLPDDADLLAMKLAALPDRDREDKRVKDLADIHALLAHGRTPTRELLAGVRGTEPARRAREVVTSAAGGELDTAAALAAATRRELEVMLLRLGI